MSGILSMLHLCYSLLPLITFDRHHTYLLSRILIVCTSSSCRCLSHSLLHSRPPSRATFLCKPGQIESDNQDANNASSTSVVVFVVIFLCDGVLRSYIFFLLCWETRETFAKSHCYEHALIFALSLDPDRGFYHYWQRNPFLSLGPGVEASIRQRRRLRAAPNPPFPTRAFSWRIRGCDPAVAMPRANTVVSRHRPQRIRSHSRCCKNTTISGLSNALSGKSWWSLDCYSLFSTKCLIMHFLTILGSITRSPWRSVLMHFKNLWNLLDFWN